MTNIPAPRTAGSIARSAAGDWATTSLALPNPADRRRTVLWSGQAFDLDGEPVRVLAYDVSPSGWTDELTQLHEQTGGSRHFIDLASRRYALGEVIRCANNPPSTILEIGCSSGFLLRDLIASLPAHRIIGADYTQGTLEVLGRMLPSVPLLQFDLTRCPLPDGFADVVILLNVLEHIGNHEAAVAELFRIVRPGGAVIIEVPAGSSLFDIYDRVLMHYRRYDMPGLIAVLENAGFAIERRSHLGAFLFPAFYISKRLNQMRYPVGSKVDEQAVVSAMIASTARSSPVMGIVMALEEFFRPYLYYPCGIRCLITGRRPG